VGDARWYHAAEIRQRFGCREFTDQPEHFRLVQWLYMRAWLSAERPSVLSTSQRHGWLSTRSCCRVSRRSRDWSPRFAIGLRYESQSWPARFGR
jgi:hypothetical protein